MLLLKIPWHWNYFKHFPSTILHKAVTWILIWIKNVSMITVIHVWPGTLKLTMSSIQRLLQNPDPYTVWIESISMSKPSTSSCVINVAACIMMIKKEAPAASTEKKLKNKIFIVNCLSSMLTRRPDLRSLKLQLLFNQMNFAMGNRENSSSNAWVLSTLSPVFPSDYY